MDPLARLRATLLTPAQGMSATAKERNGPTRPAAVLIPLLQDNGQWRLLFTKRTERVEHHKGQVSFPGGARDPGDSDMLATALRETEEEIGVAPDDVEILGALPPLVTITNFLVYPFVGLIPYPYPFRPNSFEVAGIIETPLDQLVAEAAAQEPTANRPMKFNRQGEIIWGATARMLQSLLFGSFLSDQA